MVFDLSQARFKRAMKAGETDVLSLNQRLSEFLVSYRSTPHATTNASPSELFLQRKLRTRFDLLKPKLKATVESHQADQKKHPLEPQLWSKISVILTNALS